MKFNLLSRRTLSNIKGNVNEITTSTYFIIKLKTCEMSKSIHTYIKMFRNTKDREK